MYCCQHCFSSSIFSRTQFFVCFYELAHFVSFTATHTYILEWIKLCIGSTSCSHLGMSVTVASLLCNFFSFFLEINIELLNRARSKMACMGCVTDWPWMMYRSVQLCCCRFIDMFFNATEPPSGDPSIPHCASCLSQTSARRNDLIRHQSQQTRLHYSRGVSRPISLLGTQSTTRIYFKEGEDTAEKYDLQSWNWLKVPIQFEGFRKHPFGVLLQKPHYPAPYL